MRTMLRMVLTVSLALSVQACKKVETTTKEAKPEAKPAAKPMNPGEAPTGISGKVIETMNSGGYTYVNVEGGGRKVWAAAPQSAVKVGDEVTVPQGAPMANFHSNTLNRDFELIYFVPAIKVAGAGGDAPTAPAGGAAAAGGEGQMPPGHGATGDKPAELRFEGLKKADGGKTIAELFAEKDKLAGKEVVLRAKVAKYTAAVMSSNFVHLQDGTGGQGTNDLVISTAGAAKVGDTVLVKGPVTLNKDFGMGYKYDVIIENATLTVE